MRGPFFSYRKGTIYLSSEMRLPRIGVERFMILAKWVSLSILLKEHSIGMASGYFNMNSKGLGSRYLPVSILEAFMSQDYGECDMKF